MKEKTYPMQETSGEFDDHLFEHVRDAFGTTSIEEPIDGTPCEVMRVDARRREIRALAAMDGLDLEDEEVMVKAWRFWPSPVDG